MDKLQKARLQSQVKRINERYADIVRHFGENGREARRYRELMGRISTVSTSKSGNLKIGKPSKLTAEDIKNLNYIDKLGYTTRTVRERITRRILKTESERRENGELIPPRPANWSASDYNVRTALQYEEDTHELIMNHASEIYNAAPEFYSILHASRNMTYKEEEKLWELYRNNFPAEEFEDINAYLDAMFPD